MQVVGVGERRLREQPLGPLGGAGIEVAVAVQAVEAVHLAVAIVQADDVRAELGEVALAAAQVDREHGLLVAARLARCGRLVAVHLTVCRRLRLARELHLVHVPHRLHMQVHTVSLYMIHILLYVRVV